MGQNKQSYAASFQGEFVKTKTTVFKKGYLYGAWITSLLATAVSIFFIEILGNPVATLCWVERMLILSLFLLLTVAIIDNDAKVKRYAIPFLILGIPAAIFQQLVHWDIIKITQESCTVGYVCTTKYFELFGFVTQATLCLTAFVIIAWCISRIK